MSAPTHALVVDDLPSSRDWLAQALGLAFPGIAVAQAGSLAEADAAMESGVPPLALVDLGLPDGSGVQLIQRLLQRDPACVCVVATVFDDDAHLFPALAAMLQGIAAGQPPLSPSIARRLLRHFQPVPLPTAAEEPALTARETDVLRLVAKGYSVPEVAQALGLSRHTVVGYLKDIYRKLRVSSRAEATLEATRRGLVAPG